VRPARNGSFLDGVHVLDCTRVIAGPVAGRLLSSFGADVVKVAGPLDDSPLLELDTGWGKTRCPLDLRTAADRAAFEEQVRNADVLIEAFRPGAFAALGYGDDALRADNPGLIIGHLSAFGPDGPMGGLRGFDSVVQVATGIAHACGFDHETGPSSLPAQALDHGAGHLLAAGIAMALAARLGDGVTETVSVSLARVAEWLSSLGEGTGASPQDIAALARPYLRMIETSPYGTVRHVLPVGVIDERSATWPPEPADISSK
jgi:crotonobetainyl-CoA:carnitine CoA-transferase CaiB-like acyl-CoA transferase